MFQGSFLEHSLYSLYDRIKMKILLSRAKAQLVYYFERTIGEKCNEIKKF